MDPRLLSIDDYNYQLPNHLIAPRPKQNRDESRLLIYNKGVIQEDIFTNLPSYLPPKSLIIFNNTRVIEARLLFKKPTGAIIEVFCLEPAPEMGTISMALHETGPVSWYCLVGNASGWPRGTSLEKEFTYDDHRYKLYARIAAQHNDHFIIEFNCQPCRLSFAEVLHAAGNVPLPPYIKRKPEAEDITRYQTIYAAEPGSVAAPTAGLHFTERIIQELSERNITRDFVTLHVGAGTFKPVKASQMAEHHMHAETIEVELTVIEKILSAIPGPVIAVGTTSLRTLESLYWAGRKLLHNPDLTIAELDVQQWEPYEHKDHVSSSEALQALIHWMKKITSSRLIISTSLLIAPGYNFKLADILITNFHQPKSTLLLLVAAFIGEKWRNVYSYALEKEFRFLSYGDACLFFRQEQLPLQQEVQG